MKKQLIIAIAVTMMAFTAVAGSVSYTPLVPRSYECLIFDIELTRLHAVEVKDEKGSKYIHTDFVPVKTKQIFYYSQTSGKKFWQSWHAKTNSNGKSLNGSGESRQSVMVTNPREGSTDGFIVFIMDIPRLDAFTPSIQLHLSGTFDGEWSDVEQRYMLKEGRGVVAGHSTATKFGAFDFMAQAVPSIQSPMAPAWGTFTVTRKILTENEIVNLLK